MNEISDVIPLINQRHGTSWSLVRRLPGGYLQGAYEIRGLGGERGVLKWHPTDLPAPQLLAAARSVDRLHASGWPTARWLAYGTLPEGDAYIVEEFVDGVVPTRLAANGLELLLAANREAIGPGPLMATMGLTSLIFAAFMLYRRRDIKRLFAYSSIEHMGIIVFAFGMGGPLANFAGLLHMVMHSLTKSAIFFAVGHIAQVKGTQKISEIRGLTESHPGLGWALVIGVVAIAGLPPLGIFMSEFLVVSSTFARYPWLAIPLVFGLLIAFGALLLRLTGVAFGEPRGGMAPVEASYVPMYSHLALVFAAGIYLPAPLVAPLKRVSVAIM